MKNHIMELGTLLEHLLTPTRITAVTIERFRQMAKVCIEFFQESTKHNIYSKIISRFKVYLLIKSTISTLTWITIVSNYI